MFHTLYHTLPETGTGRSTVAERSIFVIPIVYTVYAVTLKDKEERKNLKMSRVKHFLYLVFLTLRKVNRTYGVDLAIKQQKGVVCKLCAFFCLVFHWDVPITYI